jgi:hypothetical protein
MPQPLLSEVLHGFSKQVVKSIPFLRSVQSDQEEIVPFELLEDFGAVVAACDGIA